ncbi:MAG: neutral zinc metallopeptidase [Candidatus Binataceae bacterium]
MKPNSMIPRNVSGFALLCALCLLTSLALAGTAHAQAVGGDVFSSNGGTYSDQFSTNCSSGNASPYAGMDPLTCYGVMMPTASNGACIGARGWRLLHQAGNTCYFCQPINPPTNGIIVPLDELNLARQQGFVCGVDQADPNCMAVCTGGRQAPPYVPPRQPPVVSSGGGGCTPPDYLTPEQRAEWYQENVLSGKIRCPGSYNPCDNPDAPAWCAAGALPRKHARRKTVRKKRKAPPFETLADKINGCWSKIFLRQGMSYAPTPLYTCSGLRNAFYEWYGQTQRFGYVDPGTGHLTQCTFYGGTVVYDPAFFTTLGQQYGEGFAVSLIAHEIGHHVQDVLGRRRFMLPKQLELEADRLSGVALRCLADKGALPAGSIRGAGWYSLSTILPTFNPQDHGTPQERYQSFLDGYFQGLPPGLFESSPLRPR